MPTSIRRLLVEKDLMDAYRARPLCQRNDYLAWITRAKKPETRAKRVAQMLLELENGNRYMNMVYRPKVGRI
jgi:uncharacterized protein YdeI (YjbR/CyaY-like superfamily)